MPLRARGDLCPSAACRSGTTAVTRLQSLNACRRSCPCKAFAMDPATAMTSLGKTLVLKFRSPWALLASALSLLTVVSWWRAWGRSAQRSARPPVDLPRSIQRLREPGGCSVRAHHADHGPAEVCPQDRTREHEEPGHSFASGPPMRACRRARPLVRGRASSDGTSAICSRARPSSFASMNSAISVTSLPASRSSNRIRRSAKGWCQSGIANALTCRAPRAPPKAPSIARGPPGPSAASADPHARLRAQGQEHHQDRDDNEGSVEVPRALLSMPDNRVGGALTRPQRRHQPVERAGESNEQEDQSYGAHFYKLMGPGRDRPRRALTLSPPCGRSPIMPRSGLPGSRADAI